jgi:probable addiction module antidote protein/putative addiction module killer protein
MLRQWLDRLADRRAASRIAQRIVRLQSGLIGDAKPVGGGVSELRVDYGPGYRVYFVQQGEVLIILLCGGDKRVAAARHRSSEDVGGRIGDRLMAKTEPFDAARYLTSPESQAELLNDALATGDAGYVARALGVIARARGMTEVAREAGVSREALYKALSESGDPRLTTLLGVARALGVTLTARIEHVP